MKLSHKLLPNYFLPPNLVHKAGALLSEYCSPATNSGAAKRPQNRRDIHYHLSCAAAVTEALENLPSTIFANACLPLC